MYLQWFEIRGEAYYEMIYHYRESVLRQINEINDLVLFHKNLFWHSL
jgi:hypothetical protein